MKPSHFANWGRIPVLIILATLTAAAPLWAQAEWPVLYQEDFEAGYVGDWGLDNGWSVVADESYILRGQGNEITATPGTDVWHNYSVSLRFDISAGNLLILFRNTYAFLISDKRYSIAVESDQLVLQKDGITLLAIPFNRINGKWYQAKIVCLDNRFTFYIDDVQMFEYGESGDAYDYGRFAFRLGGDDARADIDDIVVTGEKHLPAASWQKTGGPNGGLGYDIRIYPPDKNIILVTDDPSGINKSFDGGQSWTQKNSGISGRNGSTLDNIPIFSLTIDPNNPNTLWAGMNLFKGLYKSSDLGETWQLKVNGITEGNEISIRGIGVHPSNPDTVFIGCEINCDRGGLTASGGKIYRSTDGGENWTCVWEGNSLARFVIFDYLNPRILYASTGIFDRNPLPPDTLGVGILKSTDGGDTWTRINNGLHNLFIGYLEMHPANPNILYAAAGGVNVWADEIVHFTDNYLGGIYRTTNGGESWEEVLGSGMFNLVTVAPSNPDVVYAGHAGKIFRSDDGGDTWNAYWSETAADSATIWGPPGIRAGVPIGAAIDPDDPLRIFINNYQGGNFLSADGSQTWTDASRGYTGALTYDLAIDPQNPATVFWVGRSGPFKSVNGGNDWTGLAFAPAISAEWHSLRMHPTDNRQWLLTDQMSKIFITRDAGASWTTLLDIPGIGFNAIDYAPSDPNIIYVALIQEDDSGNFGVYKSCDGGTTWSQSNGGITAPFMKIIDLAIHPADPNRVYLGTETDGVYLTTDGGISWTHKSQGLTSANVRVLKMDPTNPNTLYAGLSDGQGVFRSEDAAESWQPINAGITLYCPSYLNAIGKPQGISTEPPPRALRHSAKFHSPKWFNGSSEYYSIPWTFISSIAIDPTNPRTIYVADYYNGVYYSTNGGDNWNLLNEGLGNRAVEDLEISADGKAIYAGTWGQGVFRLVWTNAAPTVIRATPGAGDTCTVIRGDSLRFSVDAFDLNGDVLHYVWRLDGVQTPDSTGGWYLFRGEGTEIGSHTLACSISDGADSVSVIWHIRVIDAVGIENGDELSHGEFTIISVQPNPFNAETMIEYFLPEPAMVAVSVFDITGRLISEGQRQAQPSGIRRISWNGRNSAGTKAASGIYFLRIDAGEKSLSARLILMK